MVGSYPPKTEMQSYTTPAEDAPAGKYHSLFSVIEKSAFYIIYRFILINCE